MKENCYLFIRQNIENLKEKGKNFLFFLCDPNTKT